MGPGADLSVVFGLIDATARRIEAQREGGAAWYCGKGCDTCCRQLAAPPELTRAEIDLLRAGLATLDSETRARIREKLQALPEGGGGPPLVCPFLDPDQGVCRVYGYRPVACRTYGYYVERGEGLYCRQIILAAVERGECPDVVWGNIAAIQERMIRLGPTLPLRTAELV